MFKDAISIYEEALKLNPNNARIRHAIGQVYEKMGMDDKAAEAFKGSLNVAESVYVYNRLGIALRRKGRYIEAIEEYKKAIKFDPVNEVIYYNMGRAYLEAGMKKEAISSFRKALTIDPNFKECKETLINIEQK